MGYDPLSDRWTRKAKFPGSSHGSAVGFAIGNKGYIGTGFAMYENTSEFWEYNPVTDEWVQKADFPGLARNGAVGFSILDKGYIGWGNAGGDFANDFWEYDPATNSWRQIDGTNYSAYGAFGFSIGTKGYAGTGVFSIIGEFWEYDSNVSSVDVAPINSINNFMLQQNYPNPFNPSTSINYSVPVQSNVLIIVTDVLGRKVATLVNEPKQAGEYSVNFNASHLTSGVYFYTITSDKFTKTNKMILTK